MAEPNVARHVLDQRLPPAALLCLSWGVSVRRQALTASMWFIQPAGADKFMVTYRVKVVCLPPLAPSHTQGSLYNRIQYKAVIALATQLRGKQSQDTPGQNNSGTLVEFCSLMRIIQEGDASRSCPCCC